MLPPRIAQQIERIERLRLTGSPEALPCSCGRPTDSSEVCHGAKEG